MPLFRSRKRPPLPRQASLECIPVRNPEAEEEKNSDGILLRYPVEVKPWFQGIFRHVAGQESTIIERKLQLDALGSSVWEMINNRRSVREIAELFGQRHQLGRREAEMSVSAFIRELGRRGIVALREK